MPHHATRRSALATPTIPWWRAGNTPGPLYAYQAIDAASYEASLVNLANPGTYNCAAGVAPTWTARTGWDCNGTKWLQTGCSAVEGDTLLIWFANVDTVQVTFAAGAYQSSNLKGLGIGPHCNTSGVQYLDGPTTYRTPPMSGGMLALAGNQPYRNGAADGATVAAWGNTVSPTVCMCRLGGLDELYLKGRLFAAAQWRTPLSAGQITAVTNALCHRESVFFGDSTADGYGATDDAHSWTYLVAQALGIRRHTAGDPGTVLQNTAQTTLADSGAAIRTNGRDHIAGRVTLHTPTYVFILYGMNDLRYSDAAFSDANFQTDLGECIDAITAAGTLASNICIGSPPYLPEATYALAAPTYNSGSRVKHAAYTAACAAVATAKGTKYADVYQYMTDNGDDDLISIDAIHPNDAGHAAIAAAFLAEF